MQVAHTPTKAPRRPPRTLLRKALMSGAYSAWWPLAALPEDPQQEQEQVDEVEVEGERAHDRRPALGLAGEPLLVDLGQLLHVVRGQRGEDPDPGVGGDPVERRVGPEDVDDRR